MIQHIRRTDDEPAPDWEALSSARQGGAAGEAELPYGSRLTLIEQERDELKQLNRRLAAVSAESAELMAALEDRNDDLDRVNRQIARANAHGAELMAEIDTRNQEISHLNSALARANARASEVVAELEISKEKLEQLLDQLRAEQQARQLVEERLVQKQKLEAIGTLAGGVAHEVNNPLTIVLMNAQMLEGRLAEDADNELLRGVIEGGERIGRVIRGLQSFAGSQASVARPAHVADMIANTLALLERTIKDTAVDLDVDVPDDLPTLTCRPQQIQQVILNLLNNACEAVARGTGDSPRRGVSIRARQMHRPEGRFLRMTVADSSGTLPPESVHRVFDPFYSTKDQVYGAGMGLSVSYRIAQEHGGTISLETGDDGETLFHLDLPVTTDAEREAFD